jgi:asparagine synthase (glutamine-hydrolysing)
VFAFSFAAGFRNCGSATDKARLMAANFPSEARDGIRTLDRPDVSATILRWAVVGRDQTVAPIWDGESRLAFAGDVRLYNRRELAVALGVERTSTAALNDLELAFLAYRKWEQDAPMHLVGDFAFAVWDERRQALFATRDQLGIRPLYYRLFTDGVVLASDVQQILALTDKPFADVNDEAIRDLFIPPVRRLGGTCFSSISAVRPGCSIVVSSGIASETRYWRPPRTPTGATYEENCQELRRIFRRAVHDRLESDRPIVAHSSGGFDSSTIVMAAAEIYKQESGRPPLVTASLTAPGFPCDERAYMDAVARRVNFETVRWNAFDDDPDWLKNPPLAYPGFARGLAGGPPRDLTLARERDAGVLLSGMFGDEVLIATNILLDLFRNGRWFDLVLDTLTAKQSVSLRVRTLVKSIAGVAPPAVLIDWQRRRAQHRQRPPTWLGPRMRAMYPPPLPEMPDLTGINWPSHVSMSLWQRVTSAQVSQIVDGTVAYGSTHGIEVRLPYADVRLVELMLSIPWEQRIPRDHLRRTARDALGPLLPEEFQKRIGQRSWTPVWTRNARRALPCISHLLTEGDWLSAPFVDRQWVLRTLETCVSRDDPDSSSWIELLDLASLEGWLRRLI